MASRHKQKLALQSICNIRNIRCTDFLGQHPSYHQPPKSYPHGKNKRYSSSVDEADQGEGLGMELNGWDDPPSALDGCTNILYGLSSKLQNYELQQKRQNQEHMLDEIKENYKNIMERAKIINRPSQIFSKYREELTLYNESNELPLEKLAQKKQAEMQKRPTSNQAVSARPILEAPLSRHLKEKNNNSHYNFTKKNIEKHKSQKVLSDFPQTVGLVLKSKVGRVERVKKWMALHDRREQTTVESRDAKDSIAPSNLIRSKQFKKFDMPFIERKQRLKPKRTKLNITEEKQIVPRSEFQDTKLFGLR